MAAYKILVVIPHYYNGSDPKADNRSLRPEARVERSQALAGTILSLLHTFPSQVYGLDHQHAVAWQSLSPVSHELDIVVCTVRDAHVLDDLNQRDAGPHLRFAKSHVRRHAASCEPLLLGFECHKVLAAELGNYDYYVYLEDDIALTDPLFFRKRKLFDQAFGPDALLQPNRYERAWDGPIQKLYVDYHIRPEVTDRFQKISDQPHLFLPFLDETIVLERTSYPSSGCFILNAEQMKMWSGGSSFADGDVSYMSPLDSAATLSIMKRFRIYKSVLDQANFFEVQHLSPRWIRGVRLTLQPRSVPFEESLRKLGHR